MMVQKGWFGVVEKSDWHIKLLFQGNFCNITVPNRFILLCKLTHVGVTAYVSPMHAESTRRAEQ